MTVINKHWTEADVIADAIGERTYRDAAEWLNESLPPNFQITHASVFNWCEGAYKPAYGFLLALTLNYPKDDARHQLAMTLHEMRAKAINAHWAGGQA